MSNNELRIVRLSKKISLGERRRQHLENRIIERTSKGLCVDRDKEEVSFLNDAIRALRFHGETVMETREGETPLCLLRALVDELERLDFYRQGWCYEPLREALRRSERLLELVDR